LSRLNVFPAPLKDGDFHGPGMALHPGNQDVPSITPPVAIDLYERMLRSIDQPASPTDFAIRVFASVFGLTSPT
jgi:hypothetical protein